jgi:hypothetical protein
MGATGRSPLRVIAILATESIKMAIDVIAAPVQTTFDPIAPSVQAIVDSIAPAIQPLCASDSAPCLRPVG